MLDRLGPLEEGLALFRATEDRWNTASPPSLLGSSLLSPREREVAILIARGRMNREIAEALVISERTAETHVTHVLGKLGFRSRAQVAVWAVEHGLLETQTA